MIRVAGCYHPATRIMSLYCHMTAEVIIRLPGSCLYTVNHMTAEVIIRLPASCLYTVNHMTAEVIIRLLGSSLIKKAYDSFNMQSAGEF
jgi:hypothetical protein